MATDTTFKVYIKNGCPWCREATEYLRSGGYDFEEIEVLSNPEAFAEMKRISGQSKSPVLVAGDLLLADFGVDELVPFLRENGLLKEGQRG